MVNMHTAADLPLVGGHLALDFVNTTDEQDPAGEDVLQTAVDLRTWGERCGVLSASASLADGAAELTRALGVRELLHELFVARIKGKRAKPARLDELSALAAEAYAAATLQPADAGRVRWRWSERDLASVRHAVVTQALELLEIDPSGRLKECPGENCGWLFLDTSKRGNRRWCSMSECGQNAKDQQRRSRRQAQRQS
jgi:predicted RNA-binding Zn ribbon-like protein